MSDLKETMAEGFMTACSGDGEYQIKINFNDLSKMQAAYSALVDALRASAEPSASVREEMVKLRDDCLHESKKTDRCYTCYTDQAAYIARRIDVILAGETWLQSQAAAVLTATPLMQAANSYSNLADSATNFNPEKQFDQDRDNES